MTLLRAEGQDTSSDILWNTYYHLFLDNKSMQTLARHVQTLLGISESLEDWRNSDMGKNIGFSDRMTLAAVRKVWCKYAAAATAGDNEGYRSGHNAAFHRAREQRKSSSGGYELFYRTVRAAAPLGLQTMLDDELKAALQEWWETGTTGDVPEGTSLPNPLFAATISDADLLSCSGHPILGYHLAVAATHLAESSPLKLPATGDKDARFPGFVAAARTQFSEWSKAFINMPHDQWNLEFTAADCLSICHTLQRHSSTGDLSANLYRRQFSSDRLQLDEAYGESYSRSRFDVIETCHLWDAVGGLNILLSAGPLLKNEPWATLHTTTTNGDPDDTTRDMDRLLCAPFPTVTTLLGISPQEYWTNATAAPNVDEYMLSAFAAQISAPEPGVQWRLAWKQSEYLSGQSRILPKLKAEDVVSLVQRLYQEMQLDKPAKVQELEERVEVLRKPGLQYSVMVLVTFIKRLGQVLDIDVKAVCEKLLEQMWQPQLAVEMSTQGLYTQPWLTEDIQSETKSEGLLSNWPNVPENVFITIKVPKARWGTVHSTTHSTDAAMVFEGYVKGSKSGETGFQWFFSNTHMVFGKVETEGEQNTPVFAVNVKEDELGWTGDADIIATFPVPSRAVQMGPSHTNVGLCLRDTTQNMELSSDSDLGPSLNIWETSLTDGSCVYITNHAPGQQDHPIYNSLGRPYPQESDEKECTSHFTVNLDASRRISSITGHLDVLSPASRTLLAEKATVEVSKNSPFIFDVSIGNREAMYQLHFPVPVVKHGSRTRVARTSSYIEIIAPLADFATAQALDDFIFLNTLSDTSVGPPAGPIRQNVPITLNVPHLSLDALPILDASKKEGLKFLTTLVSLTFSTRERARREQLMSSNPSGLAPSPRMNFKESIFTMFMLASGHASGLQRGQTGLLAIEHPDRGGIHMLLFISALRLDPVHATAVLDAAVIPFTKEIIESGDLESFLLILHSLEMGTIIVDDDELVLWKRALPAFAERCRTWNHAADCEYAAGAHQATVPLSTEPGHRVLCYCGEGRLPDGFITLPEWDTAARRYATRVAISPLFAAPLVEDVFDPGAARTLVASVMGTGREGQGGKATPAPCCGACGKVEGEAGAGGGAAAGGGGGGGTSRLRRCGRCRAAWYCSAECQRADWGKHQGECEETRKLEGLEGEVGPEEEGEEEDEEAG